jgi:hypothetical protein
MNYKNIAIRWAAYKYYYKDANVASPVREMDIRGRDNIHIKASDDYADNFAYRKVTFTNATSRLFYSGYVDTLTTGVEMKQQKGNEIDRVENKELVDLSYSDGKIIFF